MKKELFVPFDKDGNMMNYTYESYPDVSTRANEYGAMSWRDNTPFEARLRIVDYRRGRSAAHFILKDDAGHEYTMFLKFMLEAIQKADLLKGRIRGRWCFAKRGANYSIVLLS